MFNPFAEVAPTTSAAVSAPPLASTELPFNPFEDVVPSRPSPKSSPKMPRLPSVPQAPVQDMGGISLPPISMPIGLPPISMPIGLPPISMPIPALRHVEEPELMSASAAADLFGGQKQFTAGPTLNFQFQVLAPQTAQTTYEPPVAKLLPKKEAPNPFAANPANKAAGGKKVVKGAAPVKRAPPTREGCLEKVLSGKGR